jgi:hypothetical protein
MLPDNARPHTATSTQDLIVTLGSDLAPSDLHVFLHLKTFLGCQRFHDESEVKEGVNTWFASRAASFYDTGIQKLVPRYKCLNNGGNHVRYVHQTTV